MQYLSLENALSIHDLVLETSGGAKGVRNLNLLESPLVAIQNDEFYPCLSDKLAFLMFSIINNHPFIDGNKRSSIATCAGFLIINGYADLDFLHKYHFWAELVAMNVATGKMNLDELKDSFERMLEVMEGLR